MSTRRMSLILLILFAFSSCRREPEDEFLMEKFRTHRASFERLREMFAYDDIDRVEIRLYRLRVVYSDPTVNTYLPEPTKSDYYGLLKKLELHSGIVKAPFNHKIIWFMAYTSGLPTGGIEKGYLYTPLEDIQVRGYIESLKSKVPEVITLCSFSSLGVNWLLYRCVSS